MGWSTVLLEIRSVRQYRMACEPPFRLTTMTPDAALSLNGRPGGIRASAASHRTSLQPGPAGPETAYVCDTRLIRNRSPNRPDRAKRRLNLVANDRKT